MKIKIDFVDFWHGFDKQNNFFWSVLKEYFDVEISDDPDFIIYSVYGLNHYQYKCHKVFYTAENIRPDFSRCDFAISFDHNQDPRHYRLPLYVLYYNLHSEHSSYKAPSPIKNKFCNFIYSNPNAKIRNEFFRILSNYKKVDSAGKHLNNLGYRVKDKLAFIDQYKFTIAFENSSFPGYTTEKLIEPLLVKSIPIYWGSPIANKEFNSEAFINVHDYGSLKEVVDKVEQIDNDNNLYKKYFNAPIFPNKVEPSYFKKENFKVFLDTIFYQIKKAEPVSQHKGYLLNLFKDKLDRKVVDFKNQMKYYYRRIANSENIPLEER